MLPRIPFKVIINSRCVDTKVLQDEVMTILDLQCIFNLLFQLVNLLVAARDTVNINLELSIDSINFDVCRLHVDAASRYYSTPA